MGIADTQKGEKMNKYLVLDLDNKNDAWYFGNKFLNDRNDWKDKIRKHQKDLESVSELKGINYTDVHSGNVGNPTQNTAMLEISIMEKIEDLERYEHILTYGLSQLEEKDADIINGLYFTRGKYVSAIVDELAIKYECDPSTIYRHKRTAVLNFVDAVRVFIQE